MKFPSKPLPKLVRDKIPDEVRARGAVPEVRVAGVREMRGLLAAKLMEEAAEVEFDPCTEELADVLEVVHALVASLGLSMAAVEAFRRDKRERLGGFDRRIVLCSIAEGVCHA